MIISSDKSNRLHHELNKLKRLITSDKNIFKLPREMPCDREFLSVELIMSVLTLLRTEGLGTRAQVTESMAAIRKPMTIASLNIVP